jgi:L-fuconolactonase
MSFPIIDSHIHIWDLDRVEYAWLKGNTSILARSYSIDEVEPLTEAAGVSYGVLVQAANNFGDTDLMLEVAEARPWLKGVVGWVPLMDPQGTSEALDKYLKNPYFRGVRHLIHDEADPKWLLQDKVLESLKMLADRHVPYDVVGVLPEHIKTVIEVSDKIPHLAMVFDHLNQPPIKTGKYKEWADLMKVVAQNPLIYAKISGLGLTADTPNWDAETLKPAIALALETFMPNHCFLGGDWPVALLAGEYVKTWEAYQSVLSSLLSGQDLNGVYQLNAADFYQLILH